MKVIQFPKKHQKPSSPQIVLEQQQVEKLVAALWDTQKDLDLLHRRLDTLTQVVSILSQLVRGQGVQTDEVTES